MAKLPHNIERISDGRGYRYRGYSKDGYVVRLYNEGGITPWAAYDFRQGGNNFWERPHLKGKYLGRRRTLALMGAMLKTITIKPED